MPLAYSNTGSASSALTGLMSSGLSTSALANAKAKGIGGSTISLNPGSITPPKAPVVTAPAVKTTASVAAPKTTATTAPSSNAGTYKGHAITPGSDAQVMAQIQAIDAAGSPAPQTTITTPASMASNPDSTGGSKKQKSADGTPTLAGIVGDLVNVAKNGSPAVTAANEALTKFRTNAANYGADISSAPTSARVMQGRQQAVQLANAQTENALSSSVTNALTGQGQQITGLGTAAGYANPMQISPGNVAINPLTGMPVASAPTQVPYGTQYLDPITGQPLGGGATAGGGSLNPVTAIPQYAQQVASGAMSYDQAVAALGGNPAFTSALTQAIHGINPSFSPIASNANASVVGSTLSQTAQQSNALALASGNAEKALMTLTTAYNNLGALQKTPVPGLNQIANYASSKSGVGVGATQAYKTAIQEARAAVSQVLASVGITPSGSENTAMALIPDDAGPEQISAAISTVRQLIQQKNQSYAAPGSVPQLGGMNTANSTPATASGAKGWL